MKTANQYLLLLSAVLMMMASVGSEAADTMKSPQAPNPEQVRMMSFNKNDLNGDGFVTRDEFAQSNHLSSAAPTSDLDIRATRIMGAFQDMDEDSDGKVSEKEYMSFMQKNGG